MKAREVLLDTDRKWRTLGGVVVATGALALSACGGEGGTEARTTQPQPETTHPTTTKTAALSGGVAFTFDSLGSDLSKGGSNVIQVYAGPENNAVDKEATGIYMDGQPAEAECKTEGREVSSIPGQGEQARTSDDWLRIDTPSEQEMWATAVYIENPQEILGKLDDC